MPALACPDCHSPMQPLFIERPGTSDVQVDRCASCAGLWFDWADVQELNHQALNRVARPLEGAARYAGVAAPEGPPGQALAPSRPPSAEAPRPASGLAAGFTCAKCSQRTPFTSGHGTAMGLVCGAHVPRVHANPDFAAAGKDGRGSTGGAALDVLSGMSLVVELLDLLP